MATQTLDDRFDYVPGKTLGRSGYEPDTEDRLSTRITQLDALLAVVTSSDDNDGFNNCNFEIQKAVLSLASDLAAEINELHEETFLARLRKREIQRRLDTAEVTQ